MHTYILRQERGLAGRRSYFLYKKGLPTNCSDLQKLDFLGLTFGGRYKFISATAHFLFILGVLWHYPLK